MKDILLSETMQKERLLVLEKSIILSPYLYIMYCLLMVIVIFSGKRVENVYVVDLNKIDNKDVKCLMTISHDTWTWHKRLGHTNFELLNDLCKH